MSLPIPRAEPSDASKAPSPPELPPVVLLGSYGLRLAPKSGLPHSKLSMVCGTLVLTKGIAPARRRMRIMVASCSAGRLIACVSPIVVSTFWMSTWSFTLTGTPCTEG